MHGFPVSISSRKASWIGMSCTVWVWKSFSDEGNMEKKQQRKYKWEIESGNKVRKKTVVWLLLQSASVKILLQQLYWIHSTEGNSEGSVLQHINVYVHEHVAGTCTSHTEVPMMAIKSRTQTFCTVLTLPKALAHRQLQHEWCLAACACVSCFQMFPLLCLASNSICPWKLSLSGEWTRPIKQYCGLWKEFGCLRRWGVFIESVWGPAALTFRSLLWRELTGPCREATCGG